MTELKDWLNSINFNKISLIEEYPSTIKDYAPYIINRCLSGNIDSILFANEMNKYSFLDKDMQYSFYLNTLRKKKRFSPGSVRIKSQTLKSLNNTMVIVMKRHLMLSRY